MRNIYLIIAKQVIKEAAIPINNINQQVQDYMTKRHSNDFLSIKNPLLKEVQ